MVSRNTRKIEEICVPNDDFIRLNVHQWKTSNFELVSQKRVIFDGIMANIGHDTSILEMGQVEIIDFGLKSIYGEIEFESISNVLLEVYGGDQLHMPLHDVFLDIGCGYGSTVSYIVSLFSNFL